MSLNLERGEMKEDSRVLNNVLKEIISYEKVSLSETIVSSEFVCCQPLKIIGVHNGSPIAWSSSGSKLSFVSGNKALYICNVVSSSENSGPQVVLDKIIPGTNATIDFLLFHPTMENILVSGGDDGHCVWDISIGQPIQRFLSSSSSSAHESAVHCACWLFNGTILVTGSKDCSIKIWDVERGYTLLETITGHKSPVITVCGSSVHNVLCSAGRDPTIKLWNIATLAPNVLRKRDDDGSINCVLISNMDGHRGDVVTTTFSEDGRYLFSGGRDNCIRVWDATLYRELRCLAAHAGDVRRLLLLNNDQFMYSCAIDGMLKLWKVIELDNSSAGISLSADQIEKDRELSDKQALDDILNGGSAIDFEKKTVDPSDEILLNFQVHDVGCVQMEINPVFPILVTSSEENEVRIWNIENIAQPFLINEFVGHSGPITSLHFLDQGDHMVSTSMDYLAFVYDTKRMQREATLKFSGSILSSAITPNEKTFFGAGFDYTIKGYSLSQGSNQKYQKVVEMQGHSGKVYCLDVSPDGCYLASGSHDYTICVWKLEQHYNEFIGEISPKQRLEAHDGHILDLAFNHPDHSSEILLASASSDHSLKVWQLRNGKLSKMWAAFNAHSGVVNCVTWGRKQSSKYLFSGSWDSNINVWHVDKQNDGTPIQLLKGHSRRLTELECSLDGKYLISASADGIILLWNAMPPYTPLCSYLGSLHDGASRCLSIGTNVFASGYEDGMIKIWPIYGSAEYKSLFQNSEKFKTVPDQVSTIEELSNIHPKRD